MCVCVQYGSGQCNQACFQTRASSQIRVPTGPSSVEMYEGEKSEAAVASRFWMLRGRVKGENKKFRRCDLQKLFLIRAGDQRVLSLSRWHRCIQVAAGLYHEAAGSLTGRM